jgi:citrate lyase subunit beta / citryl-CoA lyase
VTDPTRAARLRAPVAWNDQPIRSLLFAPGNQPRRLARVGTFGSDAVALDLEDAVTDNAKDDARRLVAEAAAQLDPHGVLAVRVNPPGSPWFTTDLQAVVQPNLDCLVLPKVEDAGVLAGVDELLCELEESRGMAPGEIRLVVTLETARGVDNVEEMLSFQPTDRLAAVLFGSVDFVLDTGIEPGPDELELLYPRGKVVLAARSAGVKHILDGPWTRIDDLAGLDLAVQRSRRLGFTGRVVIHPSHVGPVQRGWWLLPEAEVDGCERIVAAFERGLADTTASIRVGDEFVDYPVYHRARQRLERHRKVAEEPSDGASSGVPR